MAYLTSRIPAPSVACNDILHIVKTTDTSQNPAGSSFKATVSQLFQCCVNDFYVKNIHGCNTGDLFVQPLDEGDVFFGDNTAEDGFTIKLDVGTAGRTRLGLHTNTPQYTFDFYSNTAEGRFFWADNYPAGDIFDSWLQIVHIGTPSNFIGTQMVVDGGDGLGTRSIGIFVRGTSDTNSVAAEMCNPGECALVGSSRTINLNIVKRMDTQNTYTDNINFYAGVNVDETPIPHMTIRGRNGTDGGETYQEGNVGINVLNPIEKLDVGGTIRSRSGLRVAFSGTIGTNLYVNDNLTVGDSASVAGNLLVTGDETLNGNLFMTPNRKIGIGTTSPTEQLDCSESARFRNVGIAGGTNKALYVTSNGTLTTNASDARLKENISTIENALEKVTSMRGVNFSWKEDESSTMTLGFIAQELEQAEPKLVYTNENTEEKTKGVRYDLIGPLLVEAVKELDQKTSFIEYTPSSVNDEFGVKGQRTYDDNFMYIKTGSGWKKLPLMDI